MTRKRGIILLIAGLLGLAVGLFLLLRPGPQPPAITQTLPDGSTLTLTGIKTGENVSFPHGSLLNRVLFQILPTNGLRIGGRTLINRPNIATVLPEIKGGGLYLEFKTTPAPKSTTPVIHTRSALLSRLNSSLSSPIPIGSFRLVLKGDDGFQLSAPFTSRTNSDGYRYAWTPVYPRQSRSLEIGIERRDNVSRTSSESFVFEGGLFITNTYLRTSALDVSGSAYGPWYSIARFPVSLPSVREQKWKTESLPARRTVNDLEIQLDEILVTEPAGSSPYRFAGRINFQVRGNTEPVLRWVAAPIEITDSTGNTVVFGPSGVAVHDAPSGGQYHQLAHTPDPRFPWRVRVNVGRTTNFRQINLVTFTLQRPPTPAPTVPPTVGRLVATPGTGTPASIVLPGVTNILTTNLLGVPVTVIFAGSTVRFTLPENRTHLRLDVVSAVSDEGVRWIGAMSRVSERETGFALSQMRGATNFTITLAIHPNYQAEFIIRPTLQPLR